MTYNDRTAYWVQTHSYVNAPLYSPSVPPSEIDGYLSSPPSDAGSTHSIPPKMVLRYDDGRPDIPISRTDERYGRHSRRGYDTVDPRSYHDARHGGRQYDNAVPHRRHLDRAMHNAPEEIRILPATAPHGMPRSRSMSRSYDPNVRQAPQMIQPLPPSGSTYAPASRAYQRSAKHSHPEGHAYTSSVHSHGPYQSVNGFHHPNSVIYSHSAPPVLMGHGAAAHTRTGVQDHRRGMQDSRMEIGRSSSSRGRTTSLTGQRPGQNPLVVDRSDDSSSDSEADASYYASRSRGKTPISVSKLLRWRLQGN